MRIFGIKTRALRCSVSLKDNRLHSHQENSEAHTRDSIPDEITNSRVQRFLHQAASLLQLLPGVRSEPSTLLIGWTSGQSSQASKETGITDNSHPSSRPLAGLEAGGNGLHVAHPLCLVYS